MFKKMVQKMFLVSCLIFSALIQVGCSEDNQQEDTELVTISGTLSGGSAQQKAGIQQSASIFVTDYQVYCVTFTSPATSAVAGLDQLGQFMLQMPAGVAFGCFINQSSTGQPVATMAVAGEDASYGGSSSASMQLVGSANLGVLHLDLERGEVLIPRSVIAPVLQPATDSGLSLDELNNSMYRMQCIPSGHALLDQACEDFIDEDDVDTVFFRIMRATKNGQDIQGLGVWESQQAFNDCGGIDLTDQTITELNNDDAIQFLSGGVTSGSAFTVGANCPLRDSNQAADHENLDKYYAAGELVAEGSGYTLSAHDSHMANPGCRLENSTRVHFTSDDSNRLLGQFWGNEIAIDLNNGQGDCSHLQSNPGASFMVEFIKQ